MTFDTAALSILLAPLSPVVRARKLRELQALASHSLGESCPSCEATDIEDNGATGSLRTYACCGCGHQWDAS